MALAALKAKGRFWVCWRYGKPNAAGKLTKPPVSVRTGRICDHQKPENRGTYDEATNRLRSDTTLVGVGLSMQPELDLTGMDVDRCRDPKTGIFSAFARQIIDLGETYAEVSPSGTGMRLFAEGVAANGRCEADSDAAEIYGKNQYLTVTGNHIAGTPDAIRPAPKTIALLQARIAEVAPPVPQKATTPTNPKDFDTNPNKPWTRANAAALADLDAWVYELWPSARKQPNGALRVSSEDLARPLDEDLSFHRDGIRDHGRERGLTPIDAILDAEICTPPASDWQGALKWLCDRLGRRPEDFGWNDRPKAEKPAATKFKPTLISAAELFDMVFEPVRYVVPGYIAEGLTLLAGRPKLGKSWLMYDASLAVASGGECLGVQCRQGDVLYLALEDNQRRLQGRLHCLWGDNVAMGVPVPAGLTLTTEWPRANEGGLEAIEEWITGHPKAALVIVDVLSAFRQIGKSKDTTQYDADYQAIAGLQRIASRHRVAIILVHHVKKSDGLGDDPIEKVSGTLGLAGAADTIVVLDKKAGNCTLYGRGRDIEEIDQSVIMEPGCYRWRVLGNSAEVRRSDERNVIARILADNKEPVSIRDLQDATGMRSNNLRQLLFKMSKANEVVSPKRGLYALPSQGGDHKLGGRSLTLRR